VKTNNKLLDLRRWFYLLAIIVKNCKKALLWKKTNVPYCYSLGVSTLQTLCTAKLAWKNKTNPS